MKIVKGKDRDVEEIAIWDGPCANQILKIPKGRPNFIVPSQGERVLSARYIYLTERAYNLHIDSDAFCKVEYTRTNREDDDGRIYFAMKQL